MARYSTGEPAPALPAERLAARREAVLGRIGQGAAIVASAPELYRSRDTEVPYRQDSNFFYLTGFGEPEAVAVLLPDEEEHGYTLFLRERDPEREAWNGPRLGVEAARERLGASAVYPIEALEERLPALLERAPAVHYPMGHAWLAGVVPAAMERARRGRARSGHGPTALHDLEEVLGEMRLVKDAEELARMRVAAEIAVRGHRALLAAARPGAGEWEMQSALEAEFRRLGASGPAFPSIVASGAGATVLHYVSNDRRAAEGDLVLVDAGAAWGMYCSDVTRTFPVSGRFTTAQRELYEVVLAAHDAAIAAVRPGATVADVHDAAVRTLTQGMLRLGLLEGESAEALIEAGEHRRYYLHQTSHWLGLDVHDVGLYRSRGEPVPLQPGMVLTVEPGLYVRPDDERAPERFRGIGIRIEDDLLVTERGHEVLTAALPTAAAEVERMVGETASLSS